MPARGVGEWRPITAGHDPPAAATHQDIATAPLSYAAQSARLPGGGDQGSQPRDGEQRIGLGAAAATGLKPAALARAETIPHPPSLFHFPLPEPGCGLYRALHLKARIDRPGEEPSTSEE